MSNNTSLAGCHQVYKDQTARILEFLARNAGQCCDLSQVLASLKNNDRNRRLAEVGGTVPVQTAEFVVLARIIASADPAIHIPQGVLDLVAKAVNGRQYVSDAITADRKHLTDEDLSHLHFLDILSNGIKNPRSASYLSSFTDAHSAPFVSQFYSSAGVEVLYPSQIMNPHQFSEPEWNTPPLVRIRGVLKSQLC